MSIEIETGQPFSFLTVGVEACGRDRREVVIRSLGATLRLDSAIARKLARALVAKAKEADGQKGAL